MPGSGPIVIAYDGSDASVHAIREAGALLGGGRPALVVVVWKAGLGFELVTLPAASVGLPPTTIDLRTALETDRALYERAARLSQQGAAQARDAGFDAEGLVVADEAEVPIAETLLDVARERDAQAIVLGSHGHGPLGEVLLGSTTRGVLRRAQAPVIVVRHAEEHEGGER
jgi:nucleotide-binding universal stress UspA family protein